MPLITEEVVDLEAADLAADGRHYTPRQLYYAACAAVEVGRVAMAPGIIGMGLILLLVAAVASHFAILAMALALLGALLVVWGLRVRVLEAHRLTAVRARAMSYDEFDRVFLARHRDGTHPLPGLLDPMSWKPPARTATKLPLVVCDTVENAALVAEVLRREEISASVFDIDSVGARARKTGIIAVHDASPRGCALPLTLSDRAATGIIDAGIRPRDVSGRDLQIIEGAPGVKPPRDLAGAISSDEIAWLGSGRRLELAAFPLESLIGLLREALGLTVASDDPDSGRG